MNETKPWPVLHDYTISKMIDFVQDIVNGRRPQMEYVRGSSDPYTCLIDQMATMFQRGHIVDYPGMYAVMTPDEGIAVASTSKESFADTITVDTSRQALSVRGIRQSTDFHHWLKAHGLEDQVAVAGFGWDQRLPKNGATTREIEARDAHVIMPGGLYTLRTALKLVQAAIEAPEGQKPGPIYLVNPEIKETKNGHRWYFWDGLHDALATLLHENSEILAGGSPRQRLPGTRDWRELTRTLEALDIHVVPSEKVCKERLKQQFKLAGPVREVPAQDAPEFVPPLYHMKPGSTLFFATTSPDKLVELRKMLAPYDIRVARLDMLTPCNSPMEKSGTYTGNCGEKIREAIKAVEEMRQTRPWEYRRRLEAMGVKPDEAYIMVEDSGLHTVDPRIYEQLDKSGFEHATREHLKIHSRNFPGPEFGPATIGSLGERAFFENINTAIEKAREFEEKQASDQGRPVRKISRRVIQTSVFGLAPLEQPKGFQSGTPESYHFQIFSGKADMKILRAPQPPQDKVIYTAHFLAPADQNPEKKSQIELDAQDDFYTLQLSSRSKAVEGMALACRMTPREKAKEQAAATTDYTIAVHGDPGGHRAALEAKGYRLEQVASGQTGLADSVETSLARTDATLLAPFPPEKAEERFVERLYTLFSHLVARQIHPRDRDKPLIVLNPKDGHGKGCWDGLLAYYDELREIGMVKDQSRVLLQEAGSLQQALTLLDLSRRNLMRTPDEESLSVPVRDEELKRSGKFNVAVFCAATHKNQKLLDLAHATGRDLAQGDYGIVYGAGNRSMMGEVLFGALGVKNWKELREKKGELLARKDKPFLATSSTDAILQVEADDAQELREVLGGLGQYRHAGDIYERMEYMIKQSDSFLILPGGAGTVQELGALMMLKQSGHPDMQGKEIVVVDMPYSKVNEGSKTGERGFFSGLLEQIPNNVALGIHVVKSQKEAMEYMATLRDRPRPQPRVADASETPKTRVLNLSLAQAQALESGAARRAIGA